MRFSSNVSPYRYARYTIGDYAAAADAYRRGHELEPNNAAMKAGLRKSEAQPADVAEDTVPPNAAFAGGRSGWADMPRNMGGAGADGMPGFAGMFDGLADMMSDPATIQTWRQMMGVLGDGMERLMSDPDVHSNLANMVSCIESWRCGCLLTLSVAIPDVRAVRPASWVICI